MVQLTCGRVACSFAQCLLERVDGWLYLAFDDFVKNHYSRYAFKHVARIDVPTFMDPSVSQRLDAVSLRYGYCSVGRTLDSLLRSGCSILVLFTQFSVLVTILREQGISSRLSLLTCLCHLVVCFLTQRELANSSLDGFGQFSAGLRSAPLTRIPNSICSHNSKPGLCENGRSEPTR
jgi:hypothetical protein